MRISDWSSDVCSSDLAVAGPHERNCNSRAARFLGPHRATCSQSLDIVASVLSSRWVSRSIAPTSGGAQGDRRAEPSLLAVAINQDAAPRSQHDTGKLQAHLRCRLHAQRNNAAATASVRSEERGGGKEGVSTCKFRWA